MGDVILLDELAIIAVLGVVVTVLLAKLRLPTVAGLLSAGALMGPYGLGLVSSVSAIEALAEIGVVMLLFTIGLEFSLERLTHIFRQVALGGALQVGLTALAVTGVSRWLDQAWSASIFYGFVFSLSSTAIVLRALTERREIDAPHGRFIVGTLIFQDLCVVPMVLIVPFLANTSAPGAAAGQIAMALVKAVLVIMTTILLARVIVPRLLDLVDASRSREVFLLAVLALCIGTAWLTSLAGLSLALGAFLGGMVVADTEYGHRAMGDMLPLRDAFVSIFFVSLGMLFDVQVVLRQPLLVALLLAGFIIFKAFWATLAALAMRFPARVALTAGVGLAQFGEFGFVLAKLGETSGVVSAASLQPLMAAGIASMFLTPMLMQLAPHFTAGQRLLAPLERLIGVNHDDQMEAAAAALNGHIIIVGFGVAGRLSANALRACGIPYLVLEVNAETVRDARAQGEPIHYADAANGEALEHAHLGAARALVLLMNDPQVVQRVIDTARRLAVDVPILMRTRYLADRPGLIRLGAADIVAEEVEGGIEVLARLLRWCDVPRNVIDARILQMRERTQTTARAAQALPRHTLGQHQGLAELQIESVLVASDSCAVGRSPVQLEVRQRTQALVVAVRRQGHLLEQPDPQAPFCADDIIYLVGGQEAVSRAIALLTASSPPATPLDLPTEASV